MGGDGTGLSHVVSKIVLIFILFSLFVPLTFADEILDKAAQNAVNAEVDRANRYLSAEMSKQIDDMESNVIQEMKNYNDENFQIFDGRMNELVSDIKMKFVIGGLGVVFLAMGLVTYLMMNQVKRYSYETFQEELIKKQNEKIAQIEGQQQQQQQPQKQYQENQGMQQMQQQEWYPQESQSTIGMDMGQQWASDQTQMNQWQAQPAYDGAWQAPIETVPYYKEQWMDKKGWGQQKEYLQQEQYNDQPQYQEEDPMNVGQNVRGTR